MPLPNPSMSFTPFDILTAEELNDFVENDQALAAGTGFDTGAIPATAISPSAIYLNRSSFTTPRTISSSDFSDFSTASTVTVTIPPGGRSLLLMAQGIFSGSNNVGYSVTIHEGSTFISGVTWSQTSAGLYTPQTIYAVVPAPSAGSHTYSLKGSAAGGTLTMQAGTATAGGMMPATLTAILI